MNDSVDVELHDFAATEAVLNPQVQLLRSRVEAELKKPAVIMVTSALRGDGKSLTAYSLARCFIKSGHRAALVYLTPSGAERNALPAVEVPREENNPLRRERLGAFLEGMRSDYDYTVVDAGVFLSSNPAMALARSVDGILLAVRVGRAETDEDGVMLRTIEHSRGRILGVVATDAAAVADFERTRPNGRFAAHERLVREPRPARSYALSAESLAR